MIETQTKKQVIPGVFDYVFKELVTDESCRKWLAEIISDVTGLDYEILVKNIVIKDPKLRVGNKNEKKNVSDILIEVDKNYISECNIAAQIPFCDSLCCGKYVGEEELS